MQVVILASIVSADTFPKAMLLEDRKEFLQCSDAILRDSHLYDVSRRNGRMPYEASHNGASEGCKQGRSQRRWRAYRQQHQPDICPTGSTSGDSQCEPTSCVREMGCTNVTSPYSPDRECPKACGGPFRVLDALGFPQQYIAAWLVRAGTMKLICTWRCTRARRLTPMRML